MTVVLQQRLYPQPNIKKRTSQENDCPDRESRPGPEQSLPRPQWATVGARSRSSQSKRRNTPREYRAFQNQENYSRDLPALLTFAHLAFIASESAFLWAALLSRLGFSILCPGMAAAGFLPLFAILLATPARMLAIACGLSFLRFFLPFFGSAGASMATGAAVATAGAGAPKS